ncbi:hypothetical protein AMATHDRAFT_151541 [Amanita thiersii Skay4041]|uniref:Chromatin modification-related protein n=1 Tax=Amanita thiersii Skay4041 TaxID=703135 RepID=A0A2A9NJ31_9AGAR|nr:hypothetical protein AMATHDRAFT_151541 [Amanita thiersii Skay4041]
MVSLKRAVGNESALGNAEGSSANAESSVRERELWDIFREEHSEAVEQLPLAMHRQHSLLYELDCRMKDCSHLLLPLLRDYITKRSPKEASTDNQHIDFSTDPQSSESSKEILSRIVRLLDDLVRSSEEKVNVAYTINNTLGRHLRLLDHAIHEQETLLSLSTRLDMNTSQIHLPDLVVPRWSRQLRNSLSPFEADGELMNDGIDAKELSFNADITIPEAEPQSQYRRGRRSRAATRGQDIPSGNPSAKIKLSVQGAQSCATTTFSPEDMVIDPSERLYCYCRKVSFGEMIACDNSKCEREWFHLECVGLEEPPKGKWYCNECSAKRKNRKK